ncbi:hypothetical protein PBCV1_A690eR [Paramecium bursaria Chlorella virus 1]|uniref:Uncharacterized protein n=1 Tax=Paramecium bursaria Chlorella virus 1 TaxID=10506 RepID=F8TU93_PBCV1|nr:hypothetical protein PBCV1_A002cR [Paramecium bursaria Chlorella virus 1]YP_004679009.1 hypothetical protein PBCV1_A690eR [Paramecium bursaria Chlorella virus 1]AEI70017.1 hypothetical protein [Paramecium bursaria Chlorella virus 1]AEI70154.1 hypothetical protein [Paramecium bursaria Chlorella virus 1]
MPQALPLGSAPGRTWAPLRSALNRYTPLRYGACYARPYAPLRFAQPVN